MEQMTPENMTEKCLEVSGLLKHMAHPGRLMLLCLMKDGEYTVTELSQQADMSTSAVSQALSKMHNAQLVSKKKSGVETFYFIANQKLLQMMQAMFEIFCK